MTIINGKDKKQALTVEEDYKAKRHIFSEYIVLNSYESIKRQMDQDESYKKKQAKEFHYPKPKNEVKDAKSPVTPNQELSEVIDEEISHERIFAEGRKYLKSLDNDKFKDSAEIESSIELTGECFICKKSKEEHEEKYLCTICYYDRSPNDKVNIECAAKCVACKDCIKESIVA